MKNIKNLKNGISQVFMVAFAIICCVSITSCDDLFEYEIAEANSKPDLTPPAASFKATVTNDYLTYNFANTSLSATDYVWDFGVDGDGDGANDTSTDLDTEYTFPAEGDFTVTLTASDKLNATNTTTVVVSVVKPIVPVAINPEVINGDIENKYTSWTFSSFTGGKTTPFRDSGEGEKKDKDGITTSGSTRCAKWQDSESAETLTSNTRVAYQPLMVSPNTKYKIVFSHAIKKDKADAAGGDRVVVAILDGHYSDGAVAFASTPLGEFTGTRAEGSKNFDEVTGIFTSNATGEIGIMMYSISNDNSYIDNVKVTPL